MANKKRVMIVDDDPDILYSLKQILESNGYKVYPFDNGMDCLKSLDEGKNPTLIILDIMMPIMSRWDIRRKLEENPKWRHIPLIFLTARTNQTATDMYKSYGIDFIKKPFDLSTFLESIEQILNSKRKYSRQMSKCYFCL